MKNHSLVPLAGLLLFLLTQCENKKTDTLLRLTSSDETGVKFINSVEETDSFNILTQEYIYNGGGVGIGDFNNDGLQDIFFAGNELPNKMYLNKGEFKFEDITDEASVNVKNRWNSGVSLVDINNDGWMDVYVCATMKPDSINRKNMLFINKGLNNDKIPTFEERAHELGIDDSGYSTSAAFFDYDRDGDLDLYVLTNQRMPGVPSNYRPKMLDGAAPNTDKFYRNNGNNTFTNVSQEAGITIEGFGLGLAIADFNMDGWADIYVSNDYLSNDILYINNRNGSFTNKIAEFMGHQSEFSMGNDAADVNNDAMPDLMTLDMLPETNFRQKTTISNKSYQKYINNEKFKYEYQYVRNMLHINNGLSDGIKFSEVGQLSGVNQTEWSWSPLFVDFDNDGNKDLVITNGFPKDITDKDFGNYRSDVGNVATPAMLIDSIPVVKIPNYAYKNNGDLTFTDVTKKWGLGDKSFSNGAAFGDLDNDGDLDYVVSNINEEAFLYENSLRSSKTDKNISGSNFLRISLKGTKNNLQAVGAKITLHYDHGKKQYLENSIYRGFLSSSTELHFGVGSVEKIDSVEIQWPDGKVQLIKDVKANQLLTVNYQPNDSIILKPEYNLYFRPAEKSVHVLLRHEEDDVIDFNTQRTLPHKFSQLGPGIAAGDINHDGLDDFIVGGSLNHSENIFVQKPDGTFVQKKILLKDKEKREEDEGLLLFDADNDNDLDLYLVSGGVEGVSKVDYQDRLYINNGKGEFAYDKTALPEITASGSCVRAADFDGDGDLDLFVGGQIIPQSYPLPGESYILRNDHGKFTDVTSDFCAELKKPGMVKDAIWSDFDSDGKIDLVVVGEFMPITFFRNNGSHFYKIGSSGIEDETGWWNSIVSGDFDKDGDIDYVVGNLGLNNNYHVSKNYPINLFAKDFDGNGSVDPVLACYIRESMDSEDKKLYPVHFWDEINSQSPKFRRKFSRYRQYGKASLQDLLTPEDLKGALNLTAKQMGSAYVENLGQGKFKMSTLPLPVQVAPVNGMVTDDVNGDGNLDVIMIGNDYGNEVFIGRYDAFTGLVLSGDGHGKFEVLPSATTGFYVKGDAKALSKIYGAKGHVLLIATQNKDSVRVLENKFYDASKDIIPLQTLDSWGEIILNNGHKFRVEFNYGCGYLSQSSRKFVLPKGVKELLIHDSKGNVRKIAPRA